MEIQRTHRINTTHDKANHHCTLIFQLLGYQDR